jgi:hypothetical protein
MKKHFKKLKRIQKQKKKINTVYSAKESVNSGNKNFPTKNLEKILQLFIDITNQ